MYSFLLLKVDRIISHSLSLSENIAANRLPTLTSYSIPLAEMTQETIWLENTLESLRDQLTKEACSTLDDYMKGKLFGFETVLCHNDVLSGNVLLHSSSSSSIFNVDSDPQITLIDYEYSCYSYRAFDIANHFCGKITVLLQDLFFFRVCRI
jgi:thiamine kinase-like enzyme